METILLVISVFCFICIGWFMNGFMLGILKKSMGEEYEEIGVWEDALISIFMIIPYGMLFATVIFFILIILGVMIAGEE